MKAISKDILCSFLLIILGVLLVACNDDESVDGETKKSDQAGLSSPVNLSWASGPQGGIWYGAAGGLSSLLAEYNENLNIKAIPGGTVQNISFTETNEAELAWNFSFFANSAINGETPFDEEFQNLTAIGSGFGDSTFHFVVDGKSEYESIDEVFENGNMKIAIAPASNSDDFIFQKIMEFYGTSYEDMEKNGVSFFQGSYAEQAEQFKNGNVDAIFALSGLPGSSITDASVSRDLKILSFPDDLREYLLEYSFAEKTIPAGTYTKATNGDKDIQTMTAENVILVNKDVDEEVVYEITKGVNENTEKFSSIHASLESYEADQAIDNLGELELHPGAAKYYKEIGILK